MQTPSSFLPRFQTYFNRPVAQEAARPLSNGTEMELVIRKISGEELERIVFAKASGKISIQVGPARKPQVVFTLTPGAAEAILCDPEENDIGTIGVGIAKLLVSADPECKVAVSLRTGFLDLFSKGYFGVISAGGARFAAYLASRGLTGLSSLKEAIRKMRNP